MTNKQIGKVLSQIGSLLILQGENTFKTRAYANAARRVETLSEPVADMVNEDRLSKVPGLGASMVRHITELVRDGQSSYHQSLVQTVPAGFQEMLTIRGLGARKIRTIHDHLGIDTVGELEYACRENRLVKLDGFGAKTQERVLKGIDLIKRSRGFHLLDRALKEAKSLADDLVRHPDVWRAASLRRGTGAGRPGRDRHRAVRSARAGPLRAGRHLRRHAVPLDGQRRPPNEDRPARRRPGDHHHRPARHSRPRRDPLSRRIRDL